MWMLELPLAVVWVTAVAVLGVVTGLAIYQSRTTGSVSVHPALLIGGTIFATSLLGYLVTEWGPITPAEWRKPYLFRIVWQLGGGVLLGGSTVWQTPRRAWRARIFLMAFAWCVLGYLMANAPLADYLDGPRTITGAGVIEKHHAFATLAVSAPDGTKLVADSSEDMFDGCKAGSAVQVKVDYLPHTGAILAVTCL